MDKANRVAHLTMGVSDESDDIEKTPFNRLQDLTHRILENSWNRVEGQFDAKSIVECLRNSISLVCFDFDINVGNLLGSLEVSS